MFIFMFRFVRKEKEIAETKSELLQSESVRYQQRLEYIEKQLQDTEQILEKEKQRTKSLPVDVAEHEEIMKKVALLAEMEEMNKVLKSEKETLQSKIKQTEAQVKHISCNMSTGISDNNLQYTRIEMQQNFHSLPK